MSIEVSDNLELLARQLGEDRVALRNRLLSAKSCLANEFIPRFRQYHFDFQGKRLLSEDKKIALQWKIRAFPNKPICYENQQTTCGTVTLVDISKENLV